MNCIKKSIFVSSMFLLSVMLISSCKKDSDTNNASVNLLGRWPLVYQHIVVYNLNGSINNDYLTPYTGKEYLEFFDTGYGFAYFEESDQESFKYNFDAASKTITLGSGSDTVIYQITKFTANELELTNRHERGTWEGRMKK